MAVYARRKGCQWFLAVMNGAEARTVTIDLAFLGRNKTYEATLVRDKIPAETLVSFAQKRLSFGIEKRRTNQHAATDDIQRQADRRFTARRRFRRFF